MESTTVNGPRPWVIALAAIGLSLLVWWLETPAIWAEVRTLGRGNAVLDPVWELLSALVGSTALAALIVLIGSLVRDARTLHIVIMAQLVGGTVSALLKLVVGRERPHGDLGSWPSGHTLSAFALVMALWVAGRKPHWALWILATLVAASRVFVERHWPADVVAGFGVALLTVPLVLRIPVLVPHGLLKPRPLMVLASLLIFWTLISFLGDPWRKPVHRALTMLFSLIVLMRGFLELSSSDRAPALSDESASQEEAVA